MNIKMVTLIALACLSLDIAARYGYTTKPHCQTEQECKTSRNCACYCSGIGAFRNKNESDKPVFVENDPRGIYCYCKLWDYNNFPKASRGSQR